MKKQKSRESRNSSTPVTNCPAVSVVIPLYNVEKYVGECLDSILAQTFQNFEVIVVDDCSTDSSCSIVESYREKFGGRLTLSHMKKNSGGAGLPRNKGIKLSRGEYIAFVDPDDTITLTALEELYTLAKKVDADVVHCEKWYQIPDEFYNDTEHRRNLKPYSWPTKEKIFVTQPILLTDDFEKRAVDFSKQWLTWSVCLQLVRRNFILENEIKFACSYAEDLLFTMCEICCAKKYLVVPNVFYIYRLRENSAVREDFNVPRLIQKYSTSFQNGINYLDSFFDKHALFSNKVEFKYIFFKMFMFTILGRLTKVYEQIPESKLDELLRRELGTGDYVATMAFIFNELNVHRLNLTRMQKQFQQFAAQAQARIAQLEAELKRLQSQPQ